MAAARRLTGTDDPTALSYVLTALIQVDLGARQELLEAAGHGGATGAARRACSARESWFLKQGLRPIIIDPHRQQPTPADASAAAHTKKPRRPVAWTERRGWSAGRASPAARLLGGCPPWGGHVPCHWRCGGGGA